MKPIVTLTLNPSVDGASETDRIRPTHKIRTTGERYDPGGGGINVARVICALGGAALPVYFRGGPTGALLDELLAACAFAAHPIEIDDLTRISHAVFERETGLEYRFVPEGPTVSPTEWQSCLDALDALDFDYIVASGSRPAGMADACYRDVAAVASAKGARLVVDTSGPTLAATLSGGGVHLAKPSLGEFRALTGLALETPEAVEAEARRRVMDGVSDMLAITMGHEGAILATRGTTLRLTPPAVPVRSAVGAGDSFLGAMTLALARGDTPENAFRYGMAAGTAAVMTPGTELCDASDVARLYGAMTG
jgi:6-phosphofructokinase 2